MPSQYKGNRGEALNYIPSLIEEGFGNSYIADFLRMSDLGYRNQLMFEDINRLRLERIGADQIKNLDPYDPIPDKYMRTWSGETKYDYRVVVKYSYWDSETNSESSRYTTLFYETAPSQEMVLDDWAVRTQTILNTYGVVQDITATNEIHYYRNVR